MLALPLCLTPLLPLPWDSLLKIMLAKIKHWFCLLWNKTKTHPQTNMYICIDVHRKRHLYTYMYIHEYTHVCRYAHMHPYAYTYTLSFQRNETTFMQLTTRQAMQNKSQENNKESKTIIKIILSLRSCYHSYFLCPWAQGQDFCFHNTLDFKEHTSSHLILS